MRRKNFYNAKKKKFAVYQTALTALFIALMVVFNAGIYAIADHFRWYIDMTEGQVFSLDPETKELIDRKHKANLFKLELMPCFEPDSID